MIPEQKRRELMTFGAFSAMVEYLTNLSPEEVLGAERTAAFEAYYAVTLEDVSEADHAINTELLLQMLREAADMLVTPIPEEVPE